MQLHEITNMIRLKRITSKGLNQMFHLAVANKDVLILLWANIWSRSTEFLVDLMYLPVRSETHICSETRTLKWPLVLT